MTFFFLLKIIFYRISHEDVMYRISLVSERSILTVLHFIISFLHLILRIVLESFFFGTYLLRMIKLEYVGVVNFVFILVPRHTVVFGVLRHTVVFGVLILGMY